MVNGAYLSEKAETYSRRLCLEIPSRRVGSKGNQAATDFFAGIVASFGFETESPEFDCIDRSHDDVQLTVDRIFEICANLCLSVSHLWLFVKTANIVIWVSNWCKQIKALIALR
jgi:hypothetical protein